jgi:transcriptional regulator with XRE-family HTH domain
MKTIEQIEAAATKRGLTMTDVCRSAGVNYSTWWRWRKARTEPRSSKLDRIRCAVGLLSQLPRRR